MLSVLGIFQQLSLKGVGQACIMQQAQLSNTFILWSA